MTLFVTVSISYMVTLMGNTTIILLFHLDPHLHTPMYFFLTNLSLLDLCFTTSCIPQMLVHLRATKDFHRKFTISHLVTDTKSLRLVVFVNSTSLVLNALVQVLQVLMQRLSLLQTRFSITLESTTSHLKSIQSVVLNAESIITRHLRNILNSTRVTFAKHALVVLTEIQ